MKSLLQTDKECYISRKLFNTHDVRNLEKHHIFGASNRDKSEKYGLWVWLTHEHHNENMRGDPGVHFSRERDLMIKQDAQKAFEKEYPDLSFIKIFGRNYL